MLDIFGHLVDFRNISTIEGLDEPIWLSKKVDTDVETNPKIDPKRLIAESYDRIAERYLEWRAEQHREGAAPWVSILAERVPSRSKVLDLGCGAGIPVTRMLAETFDVTGVDISATQIDLARRNVPTGRFINVPPARKLSCYSCSMFSTSNSTLSAADAACNRKSSTR